MQASESWTHDSTSPLFQFATLVHTLRNWKYPWKCPAYYLSAAAIQKAGVDVAMPGFRPHHEIGGRLCPLFSSQKVSCAWPSPEKARVLRVLIYKLAAHVVSWWWLVLGNLSFLLLIFIVVPFPVLCFMIRKNVPISVHRIV